MAGNAEEWSSENCTDIGDGSVLGRGGNYAYSGSDVQVSVRDDCFDRAYKDVAFRVVLYK